MTRHIARRPVAQRLREWLIARCLAPINLDGSQVSDVTIDGQSVSQVTMDGDQVFGGAIPDSVISQYLFENDGDTSTATDSVGSTDVTLNNGPTYDSESFEGAVALRTDGTNDFGESSGTIDPSQSGTSDGMAIGAVLKPDSQYSSGFRSVVGWDADSRNYVYLALQNGQWRVTTFEDDVTGNFQSTKGGSVTTSTYQKVIVATDNTDIWVLVDGSEVARTGLSHDITDIGFGSVTFAYNTSEQNSYYDGLTDKVRIYNKGITASEAGNVL